MRLPDGIGSMQVALALGVASLSLVVVLVREPAPRAHAPPPVRIHLSGFREAWPDEDSLNALADRFAERDPFRVGHEPSAVPFAGAPSPGQAPPALVRPSLQITGVIGARDRWAAILTGIPGRPGELLVSEGDTVSGLRIVRVRGEQVVVRGPDTTWTLSVRRHP